MIKPYYETELGKLYHGDCLEILPHLEPVDLVLTSPPYDKLRKYGGHDFSFDSISFLIVRIIKLGGVLVWIVADQTIDGDETGSSFRQALSFKNHGLKLLDTMIYKPLGTGAKGSNYAYWQGFEYMFVFTNGKIKTSNRIADRKNVTVGLKRGGGRNYKKESPHKTSFCGIRDNVWEYNVGFMDNSDKTDHPAPFPEHLAQDHILSWSNDGDTVLDPMCGSGTTCKRAERLNRRWIGIEIEEKYCAIAKQRIENERKQRKLF